MSETIVTKESSTSKETRRQVLRKYNNSAKGKACRKRYQQSEKCKNVKKEYQKCYRQTKEGKAAYRRYEQSEKGKETSKRKFHKYHKINPEKIKAHQAVNDAIRGGKLPRPDTLPCHYCPAQAKHYHHHKGYAKEHWLDVVPVCCKCHSHYTSPNIAGSVSA